jgi:hypothetical protein
MRIKMNKKRRVGHRYRAAALPEVPQSTTDTGEENSEETVPLENLS